MNDDTKTFVPPSPPAPDPLSISDISYVKGFLEGFIESAEGVSDDFIVSLEGLTDRLGAVLKRLGVPS